MKNLKNKRVSFDPPAKNSKKDERSHKIKSRLSSSSINGANIDEKLAKKVFTKRNKVGIADALDVSDDV